MKRIFSRRSILPLIGLALHLTCFFLQILGMITDAIYATLYEAYMGLPVLFAIGYVCLSIPCAFVYVADIVLSLIRDRSGRSIAWAIAKGFCIVAFAVAMLLYFENISVLMARVFSAVFLALFVIELTALLTTPKRAPAL